MQPPYALLLKNFEIRGKSLVQILGADSLQRTHLGTTPVRSLYRYYDQNTEVNRLIAVSGNIMYAKADNDSFIAIGQATGKVKVTNGSKIVRGVWGTNWDKLIGDRSGYGCNLIIGNTAYPVETITSYKTLILQSNYSGSSSDSTVYNLAMPIDSDNFVDWDFWRERLFIADGENQVRQWRHDTGFNYEYWVVDSVNITSWTRVGRTSIKFNGVHADGENLDDSSYCLVWRDSAFVYSLHKPITLRGFNTNEWTVTLDTIGLFNADTTIHFIPGWVYIVKPISVADAFWVDTVATGTFELRDFVDSGSAIECVYDLYDQQATYTASEFNGGAFILVFTDCGTFNTYEYPFRPVMHVDSVFLRSWLSTPGGNEPYQLANDSCMDYQILELGYYPRANFNRNNNDRMWYSGIKKQPDELWYTEALDPSLITTFNTYNPFYLNRGDKPYATGLASIYDRLFAFKNTAIWALSGYDEFDFQRRIVYSDFGTTSPYSLTKYFNDAYLTSNQGLFQFDGQALTYHSGDVREYFQDSLQSSMVDNVAVKLFEDHAWIGLSTSGAFNNTTLLYNFSGYSELPDYNACSFTVLDAPGDDGSLIIGSDSGRVYKYGTRDTLNYTLPSPVYQSPFLSFGDNAAYKRLDKVELIYSMQTGGKIAVDVFKDFGSTAVFTDTIDVIRSTHDRAKIEVEAWGYNFSVKFTGVGTRKLEISGWGAEVMNFGEDENYK